MPNPDIVNDDIQLVHEHEAFDDFWASITTTPDICAKVQGPSAFWGGWYDLFQVGTLTAFDCYNEYSGPAHTSIITMDPLGHCLEGAEFFTENAVAGRTALVLGQLFAVYGIHEVFRPNVKNVTFYVMSSNDDEGKKHGQYWTSLETFPTYRPVDYYFRGDGSADTSLPKDEPTDSHHPYVFDPSNPVPTVGGNNLPDSIGGSIPCGPLDQAEVDQRSDVITFQTAPFDDIFAMTGPMSATLYVSSDAIDTDFTVKISDVYPTGEARLLQDNAIRMRWRHGGTKPEYLTPGQVYIVETSLWNTSYIVAPGHSLRFSISSSNWPRFSVNPNNGLLLADASYPGQNITANNAIYHSTRYPSRVTLPQVSKVQIPEVHVIKEMQTAYPQMTDDMIARMTKHVEKMLMRMK